MRSAVLRIQSSDVSTQAKGSGIKQSRSGLSIKLSRLGLSPLRERNFYGLGEPKSTPPNIDFDMCGRLLAGEFGHAPLSIEEDIPWSCSQLVIGTGAYGKLPVMQEVRNEAARKKIKLLILPTIGAKR